MLAKRFLKTCSSTLTGLAARNASTNTLLFSNQKRFYKILNPDTSRPTPPKTTEEKVPFAKELENKRVAPELGLEPAHEMWTRQELGIDRAPRDPQPTTDRLFDHPMYTPIDPPYTGTGPLIAPMKWPEYDQSMLSAQQMDLPSPPNWHYVEIEPRDDAPIGDYPRYIPMQFAVLRDPYAYWDQQQRRNFGEILYDHDEITDVWGPGPEVAWQKPLRLSLTWFTPFAILGLFFYGIELDKNPWWFAEKEYPFDGLRVELGGDPNDPSDTWRSAKSYKDPMA